MFKRVMSYFKKVYKFFPTFLPTLFNSIVSGIKYDLTNKIVGRPVIFSKGGYLNFMRKVKVEH